MSYKQWKSDLHQYFEMFDDSQVALEEGCLNEFEDRQDSWKKAKVNKINREKKTLLHNSGSRPFSYRMEVRRKGSKFPEIDVFADVYVRPGDELTELFHVSNFLCIKETLDQTFDRRPWTYCRGMGNARRQESEASSSSQSKGEVTTLTQEVTGLRNELASYKTQMSLIVQVLSSLGICLPNFFVPPPS
ncbi:unnamed protein product [Malus baccata var. baccata]